MRTDQAVQVRQGVPGAQQATVELTTKALHGNTALYLYILITGLTLQLTYLSYTNGKLRVMAHIISYTTSLKAYVI